jgi:hypothetical protein
MADFLPFVSAKRPTIDATHIGTHKPNLTTDNRTAVSTTN